MSNPFKDFEMPEEPKAEESKQQQETDDFFTEEKSEPRQLKGAYLIDYVERQIKNEDTLLGDRYLCRGGGMFIVAPSGIGKSVMAVQSAIEWAAGRESFGIKPARPLKVLIIQAEDDEGDVIEMAQIAKHLKLDDREMAIFSENVWMEPLNDLIGEEFLQVVDGFLEQFPADLLIINPYTSYLGCEVKDDGLNNHFLRNTLNPILTRRNCGCILIHHTPKTNFRDTTNWRPSDWMYSGAGASCLTNWARAYLVIDPTEVDGVYKYIAAKRGKRIGWDFPIAYWSHSRESGKLLWVEATEEERTAAVKTKANMKPEDFLEIIPLVDPIGKEAIRQVAKDRFNGMGRQKADGFLKVLVELDKVLEVLVPRKGTNPERKYVRSPE
jgi:hypothetical protein